MKLMTDMNTSKNIHFIMLLLLATLGACTPAEKNTSSMNPETITINWNDIKERLDYSYLVEDSTQIIPLDCPTDDDVIGEITNLIYENDLLYIADNLSKSVFVFDLSGKLLTRIHAYGGGPGEYINITDITVHGTDILVYDSYARKVFFYNEKGKFLREISTAKIWGMGLFEQNGQLYFVNNNSASASGNYQLFSYDMEENHFERHLPFSASRDNWGWSISKYYSTNKDEALVFHCPYDTLYRVSDNKTEARFYLDFGDRRLPQRHIEGDGVRALQVAENDNYVKGANRIHLTDKLLFFSFNDARHDYLGIYNRENQELVTAKTLFNDRLGNLKFQTSNNYYTIQQGNLILNYPADYWRVLKEANPQIYQDSKEFHSEYARKRMLELCELTEDSNPVIIIQKFKP